MPFNFFSCTAKGSKLGILFLIPFNFLNPSAILLRFGAFILSIFANSSVSVFRFFGTVILLTAELISPIF